MLTLITIATVAAVTACGSKPATQTSPTQSTSPQAVTTTGSAAPQEFVSKRYHFSVTLPKDWSEADAQVDWDGKMLQGIGSPAFANFEDSATGRTLVAAAAPVANGTQLAEWRAAMVRAAPAMPPNVEPQHEVDATKSLAQYTPALRAGQPAKQWLGATPWVSIEVIQTGNDHDDQHPDPFSPRAISVPLKQGNPGQPKPQRTAATCSCPGQPDNLRQFPS